MNGNNIKLGVLFITFIINTSFFFSVNAQSKHTALWRIGDYCVDFNSENPIYYELPSELKGSALWYTDLNGEMKIVMSKGKMYFVNAKNIVEINSQYKVSIDLVEINSQYEFSVGCFIPVPNNTQQVFYVESDKYYLIDLHKKIIELRGSNMSFQAVDYLKVHHSDCDKIWLIDTDKKKWTYYLLDSDGIKKIKEITLNSSEYKLFSETNDWQIKLSKDCCHYTMVNIDKKLTEVYYGDFDRENAVFTRKSSYDFGSNYSYIANSIIAPDNSRIYYFVRTKDGYAQLLEVPIINGIPDYQAISEPIYSEKNNFYYYRALDYGFDGKVYLIDPLRKIFCVELNPEGKTVLISKDNWTLKSYVRQKSFVSSWFMDNPCEEHIENPCITEHPSAIFDNSFVCYGQPLKLKLSGRAPFEVFYTLDGEEKTLKTSETDYLMPNVSGKYKITKIKDSACEFSPTENNISEIATEIKKIKVVEKSNSVPSD